MKIINKQAHTSRLMFNNTTRVMQLSTVAVLITGLFGCFSFGNSKVVEASQNKYSPQNIQHTRQIQELTKDIEELKSLKPQLVKLIEYENEFSYIFEQLETLNRPMENTNIATVQSADLIKLPSDDVMINNNNAMSSTTPTTITSTALRRPSVMQNSRPQQVVLESNTGANVEIGVADDKFKSMAQTSVQSNETIDAKFASLASENTTPQDTKSKIIGRLPAQADTCKSPTGEFAIHLVSYSTEQQANKGWADLNSKVADITCNRRARLQEVIVRDKTFYSVRVGPYDSDKSAREICSLISQRGQYCGVSEYTGNAI